MALIYPITTEEAEQLQAVNDQDATFVPCWWPVINGLGVSVEMLEDPAFSRHREVFLSWEQHQPVEVTVPGRWGPQ